MRVIFVYNFYFVGEEIRPGKYAIVLVIHGESWDWGSGNEFDGGALASLGNHIVVTFNYRLGILGKDNKINQETVPTHTIKPETSLTSYAQIVKHKHFRSDPSPLVPQRYVRTFSFRFW